MASDPNKLSHFWQELKRRKVVRVITAYAAAAFVIIELVNNVAEPLHLPQWTATLVILLLAIGFPVVLILSWIFDFTPEGIRKTESVKLTGQEEQHNGQKEQPPQAVRRKLKASDIVIVLLLAAVCILLYPKIFNRDRFQDIRDEDGRISIAVMPFENLTGDTLFNGMELGIQNLVVTRLSNSEELLIRQAQTVADITSKGQQLYTTSMSPAIASQLASQLNAGTAILGSLHKSDKDLRLTANLLDSRSREIFKSFEIETGEQNALFVLADSLTFLVSNYFQIRRLEKTANKDTRLFSDTDIAGAYRYFSKGMDKFFSNDFETALTLFEKALELDPDMVNAKVFQYVCFWNLDNFPEAKRIVEELYEQSDQYAYSEQLYAEYYKSLFDKDVKASIRYLDLILEEVGYSRGWNYEAGRFYYQAGLYSEAVVLCERAMEIDRSWGEHWEFLGLYLVLGNSYHRTGQFVKAQEIYDMGREILPDEPDLIFNQAVWALSQDKTQEADKYISNFRALNASKGLPEKQIDFNIGNIYEKAEQYDRAIKIYRELLESRPEKPWVKMRLASVLFKSEADPGEAMDLIDQALEKDPDNSNFLRVKGQGLLEIREYKAAHEILLKAWDQAYMYDHELFLLLQEAEQAASHPVN